MPPGWWVVVVCCGAILCIVRHPHGILLAVRYVIKGYVDFCTTHMNRYVIKGYVDFP